jgi:hypothetical protein
MGWIRKGNKLYASIKTASGKWVNVATGFDGTGARGEEVHGRFGGALGR